MVEGFDLKCGEVRSNWHLVRTIEYCEALNMNITSRNKEITSVNGRTGPTNLTSLEIEDQIVHYLPKGIDKFFPNLKLLKVASSKLKSVMQEDLKPLTELEFVRFLSNDLETLDGDLFEFNPNLKFVDFDTNKIKYVGEILFNHLNHLQEVDFRNNPCINVHPRSSSAIHALVQKLKSSCKFPSELLLIKRKERMKEEIAELKKQTNQKVMEMNSEILALTAEKTRQAKLLKDHDSEILALKAEKTRQAKLLKDHEIQHGKDEESIRQVNAVVALIQDEHSKLKRWLKSCDGNLNAVTGILFKASDRQQFFIHPSSESLGLIVEVEGSKVIASELVITSPGSMMNSVKYFNESDVIIKATELQIDHQQTLFLPTNLGQHFPLLQVLVVTSSGLIQIDSSVFGSMRNLKVLNLTSNKLQEIEPGTFEQLKLLESLDLSSNNLRTLEISAINGLGKLQVLNLTGNRLKVISANLFEPLKVLQIADLPNNDCINMISPKHTLKQIKDQFIEECSVPVEIECFMLGPDDNGVEELREDEFDCIAVDLTIVHPKTKISKLKNQIDSDSFTFSVIDQRIAFLPIQLNKTFTNLNILVVIRSKLTALNQCDFKGLNKLTNITIVHNNISLIEPGVFDDVPQLIHLNLSSNNIKTLPAMLFVKLVQLKTLNLSDNRLQSFFSELLPMNNVIEEIHIKNNELQKISLANSIDLKNSKIIDLTENICIHFKYEKDKTDGKALPELFRALRDCSV